MTMEATIPKHHPEPTAEAHEDDDASFEMTSRSVDDKFSIPGHISVSSGMTGVESLEPEDEVRNVENLTKGDTRLIQFWRFVVVACMALAGVAVSVGAYTYISELEKQDGQNAFILFSNTITDISKFHFKNMFEASRAMSRELTAEALLLNKTFPFVTFPNYEVFAKQARDNAGLEVLSYAPVVTLQQSEEFVKFAVDNQEWITQQRIMGMALDKDLHFENVSNTQFHPEIYDVNPLAGETFGSVGDGPFTPLMMTSPPPQSLIYQLYNFASDPEYETIYGLQEDYRDTMFGNTNFFLWTVVDFITGVEKHQELHDKRHKQIGDEEGVNVIQPHGSLVQPVYRTLDHDDPNNEIVGYLMGIMAWDAYLIDLLPKGISGVYVVVENTCGHQFTYRLNGNQAMYLGEGDLHEKGTIVDGQRRYIDFDENYLDPTVLTTVPGHCIFSYRIYPSDEFYSNYMTNLPTQVAIASAAIFFIMAVTFFVLLHFVEKRHHKIVGEAAISNAIVSSLFPSSVRKRLFNDRGALLPDEQKKEAGRSALRSFLTGDDDDDDGVVLKKAPIADLFPSCTIFFADLVGFTSWSSKRQPAEVFVLLETLYRAFDAIAHSMGVFKVETIGDCYVAVCGLPTPRRNHALVMAKFSRACLAKMNFLLPKLAYLGEDTLGLAMRVGLHSGPVTAGVLRGERSRFQLFGDSVNTAARMESNGKSGRVHVSEKTAFELKKAGKGSWIVPRSDKIEAKGKGLMQTFWLAFNGETDFSGAFGLDCDGTLDTDRRLSLPVRNISAST